MTAEVFLSELARQNLVPGEIIESLRRQVAKAAKPVAPQTLAKLLVEKGHLTAAQGQRILGTSAAAPALAAAKSAAPAGLEPLAPIDDLGLTPLDDLSLTPLPDAPVPAKPAASPAKHAAKPAAAPAKPATAAPAKPAAPLDDLSLTPLDDLLGPAPAPAQQAAPASKSIPKPAATAPAKPAAPSKPVTPAAKAKVPAPIQNLQPLDGLEPLDGLAPLPETAPLNLSSGSDVLGAGRGPQATTAAAADPFAPAAATAMANPFVQPMTLTPADVAPAAVVAAEAPVKKSSGALGIAIGLVVVLLIAGGTVAAFFLIPRAMGEKEFAAAEQDYQGKQYGAAIEKYDAALDRFPNSPLAGPAKVKRAMAKLLAASSIPADWPKILLVAKEALPPVAGQPELPSIHAELAPLLTDMADGLTTLAAKAKTSEEITARSAEASDALALTNDARFVPGTLRQWQRLANAEETLAALEYSAKRGDALDAAVAKIKEAATSGKPDAAYAERSQLLMDYPDLATTAALRDAFQQVAQAEAARVTPVEEKSATETTETQPAIVASLAFATPIATTPAAAPGRKFITAAAGSVWAFDGATGKLLWRRPARNTSSMAPVPVAADAASDVLIADDKHLLRVASATGALVWRRSLDNSIAGGPVVAGKSVVVATRSGRVLKLDAANGDVLAAGQLPQQCRVPPAISADGNHVYQLADHSHLYALAAADLKCEAATYVGHERASVATAPFVVGQHLVIGDNAGAAHATLQVVALKEDGLPQGIVQRVSIAGLVLTPPVVLGKHLVVVTDRAAHVPLRITSEKNTPLELLSEPAASSAGSAVRHGLPLGEKLVITDGGLRLEALDAGSGGFQLNWTAFAGDDLLGPPQLAGDVLFCVRQGAGGVGAVSAAVQASTGKPLWQTRIAVPLASGPLADAGGQFAVAVNELGASAKLDLATWQGFAIRELPAPAANQPAIRTSSCLRLTSGEIVMVPAGGMSQIQIIPADGSAARSVSLPAPLAAAPIVWSGGILAACTSGDVVLVDPATGAMAAEPLQIPISPGQGLRGCSLAAADENAAAAVLSDGQTLRLIGIETDPRRLAEQTSAKVASPMSSAVAALGQHAIMLLQHGELHAFAVPALAAGPNSKLDAGAVVFGPERLGNRLLLATDKDELWCFDAEAKQLWKAPLKQGSLAGSPVEAGGSLILATKTGTLTRLGADSGQEQGSTDLGQTLAGTPVIAGQFVLVPAADGTLLKVALPAEGAANP
jgi:outer membrane protein assembly factor BamB